MNNNPQPPDHGYDHHCSLYTPPCWQSKAARAVKMKSRKQERKRKKEGRRK